ncbi:heavy metal translocating P-type ATPase [Caenimonas terrae]|uniref:Heavy metal translocating P-type ATPase n=1 Tax=Caenimonas terrae TaxID=696074 RepID=A0ABW0NCS9_9BURK
MQTAVVPQFEFAASAPAGAPLDEPAEWQTFSRPLAGHDGRWESWLAITGMHCAACSLTVEAALAQLPGVLAVEVNGPAALARVVWSPQQTRPSAWLAALGRAGYGALPAGDVLAAQPRRQAARLMLWRWLVAGFCMMQVMMYAFPAYIAKPGEITPDIVALLLWASWILTLPVVLFCCQPFFASALRDLRQRRIGMDVPVALGVLIAFAASTATTFGSAPGGEVWYDSVTMFVFFLLSGRLLEARLRDSTAGALEALMRRLPATVERKGADGRFERVPVRRLAFGDLIRVLPGEAVPADGVVEAGASRVDEALLTGESTPLWRGPGLAVVAGSHNLSGPLQVRVMRTGNQTRYAEIVALMQRASLDKPRLAQLADRIASPFLLLVLLASAGAAAWWWPAGPAHAIGVAVAVLIVTCPCALSLATPAATLAAAGAMARRGVLVRRLQALESCAAVDTVVFDKTGTLTSDRMSVGAVAIRSGADPVRVRQQAAALASQSLHPASRAIAASFQPGPWSAANVAEVPGGGIRGTLHCAEPERSAALRLGSAPFCGAPASRATGSEMQAHLADEAGWLASFELHETLRADAVEAIASLRRLGVAVHILSGDRPAAVARVAGRAGIALFTGGCTPQDKLARLDSLQARGHRVAMVGDGLNDGPALARADVSVAVGEAVPLAQAQADVVIAGAQLARVASLLRHARRTRRVVRQNLAWAALYNAVCVPLAIAGAMPPWLAGLGMAASSLLVVLNSARLAHAGHGA